MSKVGKLQSDYLQKTRVIFKNIGKNPQIALALSDQSFSDSRIQEGLALHGAAEQAFRVVLERRQLRNAASEDVKQKYTECYAMYSGHLNRLRKELTDTPSVSEKLNLKGKRGRTIAKFIEETNLFYATALNNTEVAAAILPFGFTPETVQAAIDELSQYQNLRSEFERLAGECQKLLVDREKAIKALRKWMAALAAACRVAFTDNLQTMEEIGFFVRNKAKSKNGTGEPEEPADPPTNPPTEPPSEPPTEPPADPGTNP